MEISATHSYPQPPDEVFAMLTDPTFLDAVCAASEPVGYEVAVDGLHARTRRTMKNDPSIEKFTGPTITVIDEIDWAPAPVDGVRTGVTLVTVERMPVRFPGTVTISPRHDGSTVTYDGELTVAIPFVGSTLERKAAPLLLRALDLQAEVAQSWGE